MTKDASKAILVFVLLGAIITTSIWGCGKYRSYEAEDLKQKNNEKDWLISKVKASRFGSKEWRDQTASDFLGKNTTTDACQWFYARTWHGSTKNPNWFSESKGVDGGNITCETYANDQDRTPMWFEYELRGEFGIVGLKWGYSDVD